MERLFENFLLNEQKDNLIKQIGNLLNSMQNLKDDLPNLSRRSSDRAIENTVNYIRRILHSRWDDQNLKILKKLQTIAVALMNCINTTTEDTDSVVVESIKILKKILEKSEEPLNEI